VHRAAALIFGERSTLSPEIPPALRPHGAEAAGWGIAPWQQLNMLMPDTAAHRRTHA